MVVGVVGGSVLVVVVGAVVVVLLVVVVVRLDVVDGRTTGDGVVVLDSTLAWIKMKSGLVRN